MEIVNNQLVFEEEFKDGPYAECRQKTNEWSVKNIWCLSRRCETSRASFRCLAE